MLSSTPILSVRFENSQTPSFLESTALSAFTDWPALKEFSERLLVLASWTKLWACPGLRLGSLAASAEWTRQMKKMQTPWSCNLAAQEFAVSACRDKEYIRRSWDVLLGWRQEMDERVGLIGWKVNRKSPAWVPWCYVDCGKVEVAKRAVEVVHRAGCPVRYCDSFGFEGETIANGH